MQSIRRCVICGSQIELAATTSADSEPDAAGGSSAGEPTDSAAAGQPVARSFGAFCSQRCQAIDLGSWLDQKYTVSREVQWEDVENGLPTMPTDRP